MGVYHPWNRTGVVHFSFPEDAPTKKIWSWGGDADGLDWRKALSDDQSAYVEIQAGLFRDQETYGLLGPQATIRFTEYWMPVRGIGGISRANADAVVHLSRSELKDGRVDLTVGVNVNHDVRGGRPRVAAGDRNVAEEAFDLAPSASLERRFAGLDAAPSYSFTLLDAAGRVLLAHTEGVLDALPAAEVKTGPQPYHRYPLPASRSEGDALDLGLEQEREGRRLQAFDTYRQALARFPESLSLLKAQGRMAVDLQRFAEAVPLLERARIRASSDPEVLYSLGLALAATGEERDARTAWEAAMRFPNLRAAAGLELSRLDAREGRREAAVARLRAVATEFPDAVRAGSLEVALLRALGRPEEARARVRQWLGVDPTSNLLRHEAGLLGSADDTLGSHLAAEPERALDLASEYMGVGLWADALAVLDRRYTRDARSLLEPGSVLPQDHPLVVYYRGYCREKTGGSAGADFAAASSLSTRYVFPSRAGTFPVLRRALEVSPSDATAHFLLGSLHLAGGEVDAAIAEWQEARRLDRAIPILHRNLGLALLHGRGDARAAFDAFREGMDVDGSNPALYFGADTAASLVGLPAAERVSLLERFPDRAQMPPGLVQKLALALTEVGRGGAAEALFHKRYFPREEGGTNVRQVYLEVRLRQALALARAGRAREAAAIVNTIDRPVKGLAFTADGLDAFLETARLRLLMGDVLAAGGRRDEARRQWERAREGQDGAFLKPVHVALAERRLGRADEAAERPRLEEALAGVETFLAQGTSFPGVATYAQALMLRALGREDEARDHFRRVFLLPDLRLSHFLARRALEGNDPL
jgi:tetratricopeptide (TPR) repeat protein